MKSVLVILKQDPHDHVLYIARLKELAAIAEAVGYKIWDEFVQTRVRPSAKYLIGDGKVEEIKKRTEYGTIFTVIFWNNLTSRQKYDLERALHTRVIDRSELILELFERNARTSEAKLQIQLASLKKQFPYEKYRALQRFYTEQPGPKSSGEYAYKAKVRHLQDIMRRTAEKLEKIREEKKAQRKARAEVAPVVALTGFYNAGKSTLFNALTKGEQPVADYPFTTLASKVSKFYYGSGVGVDPNGNKKAPCYAFLTDSIGLVQDMDSLHEIIASFEMTLDDVRSADLVLCLIDFSEDLLIIKRKLFEALKTLRSLDVKSEKILMVFNKIDSLSSADIKKKLESLEMATEYILLSAKTGENLDGLREAVMGRFLSGKIIITQEQ
jgi:GTP-binding protein HflX